MRILLVAVLLPASLATSIAAAGQRPETTTHSDKHLLLDDRLIDRVVNARLVLGSVEKHRGNPLFGEDRSWEKRFDNLYANILRDQLDGLYKCWYSPFIVDHSSKGMSVEQRNSTRYRPPPDREMGVCYAVSRDGIKWEKPELDLVEYEGTRNNLVLRGPHGSGVFQDLHDSDPQRRYKMFHARDVVRFSSDGIHWSDALPCPGVESRGDTHNNLLWVPELNRYAGFVRLRDEKNSRIVGRTESADLKSWTPAVAVLGGDAQHQTYSMPVFRYANVYLGLVAIFRRLEDRVHTELAWSPDTVTWHRVQPGTPFIGNSPQLGDYDWGCAYAAACPVLLDDEIRIYYGGSNGKHTSWREGFLCLATLRPDGWAGYEPQDRAKPAIVVTKPLIPGGSKLYITADVAPGGSVRIAIEGDADNTLAACAPINTSVTDAPVVWRTGKGFGVSPVALRFELNQAKLYSFRLGDKQNAL